MKKKLALLVVAAAAIPASAQIAIGPRIGANLNQLVFDENELLNDPQNCVGMNGGLMVEAILPGIGIGMDASIMYVNRSNKLLFENSFVKTEQDYVEIPVNIRYKLNYIPYFSESLMAPFVFTGPSFSVLVNDKRPEQIKREFLSKNFDMSWNFGAGVELFGHLQVSASYGFNIDSAMKYINMVDPDFQNKPIHGKNQYWTATAAWLF